MQSILYVNGSNGVANASLMTVTTIRSAGASVIAVNTVLGAPTKFYGSMGTPHTFTDPVTSEVITVISDATAVDFAGTISGSTVTIDQIAPGYTDLGSKVGDIVIIRPVTEWANNLKNILNQSHNDDGSINTAGSTAVLASIPMAQLINETELGFIASGGIWAGISYGASLAASMTAIVVYINGQRGTIAALATRTFTASKDTYVDILNTAGVFTIVYTEVANNAASPTLAANSIRLAIIVSGTTIAAVGSVNQGQETALLPIVSSAPYAVTDSLGNLIAPRDPNRRVLGYRQITVSQLGISATTDLTGLAVPFIAIAGRRVRATLHGNFNGSAANLQDISIREASTTLNVKRAPNNGNGGYATPYSVLYQTIPAAGAHTWKASLTFITGSGTVGIEADAAVDYGAGFLLIEQV